MVLGVLVTVSVGWSVCVTVIIIITVSQGVCVCVAAADLRSLRATRADLPRLGYLLPVVYA